ncbi:MAG: SCO family protein [Sphingobium sp.]|nr:SCO family protein [Sphingobium sp.]
MAGHVMNKAPVMSKALVAVSLLLSACSGGSQQPRTDATEQGDLVGARIGGPFTLTDQNGREVKWSDFAGKYRIVYFGYTWCPDVCPLDLSRIVAGLKLLEKSDPAKAAEIQPIFITVDPERDTPAKLKAYVEAFHPRLIGLTGPAETIEQVKKAFVVVSSKQGDPKAKDYLVSHSRTPYLFGPDGKPIALVPTDADAQAEKVNGETIRDFLEKWVK